jgi:hypothetical protein
MRRKKPLGQFDFFRLFAEPARPLRCAGAWESAAATRNDATT